jgi:hypothetical protein
LVFGLALLIIPAYFYLLPQLRTSTEPTTASVIPSPTAVVKEVIPIGTAKIVYAQTGISYQVGAAEPSSASAGDEIPAGPEIAFRTTSDKAQISFNDGSEVVLGPSTTVYLYELGNPGSPGKSTLIVVDGGEVLVLSGDVEVRSKTGGFLAWNNGAVFGVRHDPDTGSFYVDCFGPEMNCVIRTFEGLRDIKPDQSRGFENFKLGAIVQVNYDAWTAIGISVFSRQVSTTEAVPVPSETVSATIQPTRIYAPTPTPTLPFIPSDESSPREDRPLPYGGAFVWDDFNNDNIPPNRYQPRTFSNLENTGWITLVLAVAIVTTGISRLLTAAKLFPIKNSLVKDWYHHTIFKTVLVLTGSEHKKDFNRRIDMGGD